MTLETSPKSNELIPEVKFKIFLLVHSQRDVKTTYKNRIETQFFTWQLKAIKVWQQMKDEWKKSELQKKEIEIHSNLPGINLKEFQLIKKQVEKMAQPYAEIALLVLCADNPAHIRQRHYMPSAIFSYLYFQRNPF